MKYKKTLDDKNVQIIQFYLDMKFICKGLVDSLRISDSSKFCSALIEEIKEYYNLEDLIIIDSLKMDGKENNTNARSQVLEYLKENMEQIVKNLNDHKLEKFTFKTENMEQVLYISRLADKGEADGLIVCVENFPSLLNKHEQSSLENAVNLLKTRLMYD